MSECCDHCLEACAAKLVVSKQVIAHTQRCYREFEEMDEEEKAEVKVLFDAYIARVQNILDTK